MNDPATKPAGAEMDRLVATRVLGIGMATRDAWWEGFHTMGGHGHYSTNIAHAWEVVERMRRNAYRFNLRSPLKIGEYVPRHLAEFSGVTDYQAVADTAALAICRAGLRAVGEWQ